MLINCLRAMKRFAPVQAINQRFPKREVVIG